MGHRGLLAFFIVIFLATMWPIYPAFNRIFPFVFGIPFSLFYVVSLTALSFLGLLTFHFWVGRTDE